MNVIIYVLMIFILLCIFLMWYILTYNKYQSYIIRINEAEANIDSTLRKRFDLLSKSTGIIETALDQEEIMPELEKLKNKKLTNFDLDRKLLDFINEFHTIMEANPTLKENEEVMKILVGLNESEIEISALRKYYNDIITDYNKCVRSFPSNVIGKLSRYKIRAYFDGKNMEDEVVNDFKL